MHFIKMYCSVKYDLCIFLYVCETIKKLKNFKLTFRLEIKYKLTKPQGWKKKFINPTYRSRNKILFQKTSHPMLLFTPTPLPIYDCPDFYHLHVCLFGINISFLFVPHLKNILLIFVSIYLCSLWF